MTRTFTPDDIAALIAKLEAATGPDRELDADVMAACFTWAQRGSPYLAPHCIGDEPIYWHAPPTFQKKPVPDVTASIDAALTLVPENHDWSLLADNGEAVAGCAPASEDGCAWADSHGATPALALCIAVLKARAQIRASGARPTGSKPDEAPPNCAAGSVGRDDVGGEA